MEDEACFRKCIREAYLLYVELGDVNFFKDFCVEDRKSHLLSHYDTVIIKNKNGFDVRIPKIGINDFYITEDQYEKILWYAHDEYLSAKTIMEDGVRYLDYLGYKDTYPIDKITEYVFYDEMKNIKLKVLDAYYKGKIFTSFDPDVTKDFYEWIDDPDSDEYDADDIVETLLEENSDRVYEGVEFVNGVAHVIDVEDDIVV